MIDFTKVSGWKPWRASAPLTCSSCRSSWQSWGRRRGEGFGRAPRWVSAAACSSPPRIAGTVLASAGCCTLLWLFPRWRRHGDRNMPGEKNKTKVRSTSKWRQLKNFKKGQRIRAHCKHFYYTALYEVKTYVCADTHTVFVVRLSPPESWTCYSSHLQLCPLFRSHDFQRRHHQPAAFVILDVGTNLPSHSRVSVAVQVVVLKVNAWGRLPPTVSKEKII